MNNQIKIISSCKMGPGTFEAKFIPLSRVNSIEEIIIVRKEKGPDIPKIKYYILPKLCLNPFFNIVISSYIVSKLARKYNAKFILAYHYLPHFFIAYIASILSSKPYILGQTGSDIQLLAKNPIKGLLLRHIIKKAYQINVPGSESLNFWHSMGVRRVLILHSTIDTTKFVPNNCEKEYDFIYIGRLEKYKGVQYIIESFSYIVQKYPETKLCIVGYGSYEIELKRLIQTFNLANNVILYSFQLDTYSFYLKSKIFVMASETEGLPCALMEAMSCELLCISSLVGNIGDVLKDGITGFTFSPGNISKLKELMIMSLENYNELTEVKRNARELIVNQYSYEKATDKWNKIISSIL